jgi:transposase InsO family protein
VLELASRQLLGWSMGPCHDAELVCDALDAAVTTGGRTRMEATIFHTDRGAEGGFNWSLQHPEQRGVDGTTMGLGCCGDRKAADAVAWPAAGGAA